MTDRSLPIRKNKGASTTKGSNETFQSLAEPTGGRSGTASSETAPFMTHSFQDFGAVASTLALQLDAELARKVALVARSDIHRKLFDQFISVLEESAPNSDEAATRRCVAERFAQMIADPISRDSEHSAQSPSEVAEGWAALLDKSREHKAVLLKSKEFKSVRQASRILGVTEDLVRRRIGTKTLFALTGESRGPFRIPLWALHKALGPSVTRRLLQTAESSGMDIWWFYLFMTGPRGEFEGLRPLDLLTSRASKKGLSELRSEGVDVSNGATPQGVVLDLVCAALRDEMQR